MPRYVKDYSYRWLADEATPVWSSTCVVLDSRPVPFARSMTRGRETTPYMRSSRLRASRGQPVRSGCGDVVRRVDYAPAGGEPQARSTEGDYSDHVHLDLAAMSLIPTVAVGISCRRTVGGSTCPRRPAAAAGWARHVASDDGVVGRHLAEVEPIFWRSRGSAADRSGVGSASKKSTARPSVTPALCVGGWQDVFPHSVPGGFRAASGVRNI